MVGDIIEIHNSNVDFDGFYRVLETVWDGLASDPPTGWVCYDHPTAAAYSGNGWVLGHGWYPRPEVQDAVWSGSTVTLTFKGPNSIRHGIHNIIVGDTINVMDITPTGYNGQQTVTAVTEYSVSYTVADQGAYTSGGVVEYVGSVKEITDITVNGPPPNPPLNITAGSWGKVQGTNSITITVPGHAYAVNDSITVSGVNPATYDGTYTVSKISGDDIIFPEPTDPGTYVSGGTVPDLSGGGTYTLVVTLNTNNNSAAILNMTAASGVAKDGDIVRIYGVDPPEYNERWEGDAGGVDSTSNPPTITLRCPPLMRTDLGLPACDPVSFGAYASGGTLQSTGTMRDTVFDSRGSDATAVGFLTHDEHSFATQDMPAAVQDGYLYGPCELCHTSPDISKHQTIEYGTTHNNGRTCTTVCHFHSDAFDKATSTCPRELCIFE